jgi:hypothetical protein
MTHTHKAAVVSKWGGGKAGVHGGRKRPVTRLLKSDYMP